MKSFIVLIVLLAAVLLALPVSGQVERPDVVVNLINQNPDPVEPGDNVELRFKLENRGTAGITALQVELLEKYPFTINEAALKNVGSLDAKQVGADAISVKYTVSVAGTTDEGEQDIYLRYSLGTDKWTTAGPFKVSVKSVESILSVVSVETPQGLSSGREGELNVHLKNFGKSRLNDVRVIIDLSDIPLAPVGGSNENVIGSMSPGQSATATFRLVPGSDAVEAHYKTKVILKYVDDSSKSHSTESIIGLRVYNEPEFNLALKEAEVYTPGSTGEVVLSISNTGPGEIRFMTAELLDSADYNVLSSPTFYIGNLEADDFETLDFDISLSENAPKPVDLKVRLTYKDSANREIVSEETVELPLYSSSDARRFGLTSERDNFLFFFLQAGFAVILLSFVLFMLIDCSKNDLPQYKKAIWMAVILTGIGAALYYFIARRKK